MSSHARIRLAAGAVAAFMTAGAVFAAPAAQAAVTEINPFASSGGFTVVADGDASLGNGELEGSIAVTGALSSSTGNYPIRHQAAGSSAYTVPTVDGDPVRILAGSYTGTGGIDLVNGNAPAGSAEEAAIAKFVSVAGLTAGQRGGGVGPAAGVDFTRLTTGAGGVLDVKALPWTNSATALAAVTTEQDAVADYIDLDGYDTASQCLAEAYDTDIVNMVDARNQGGLATPGPFATDKPNVLGYADIAGATIKRDNFGGYEPTAEAPLIIRVPAGTTTVSTVNIEGWSAGAGQQQGLAAYIMFDLSAVTGSVTIDGVELGAIFAPNADVTFTGSRTHNGQWVTRSFTAQGGGELHHYAFAGTIGCELSDDGDADAGADANTGAAADADADGAAADADADGAEADANGADAAADANGAGADADGADAGAGAEDTADADASVDPDDRAADAAAAASASTTAAGSGTSADATGSASASDLATTGASAPIGLAVMASLLVVAGAVLGLRARRQRV